MEQKKITHFFNATFSRESTIHRCIYLMVLPPYSIRNYNAYLSTHDPLSAEWGYFSISVKIFGFGEESNHHVFGAIDITINDLMTAKTIKKFLTKALMN